MSASYLQATELLCRLLELGNEPIGGMYLHESEGAEAAAILLRERLLNFSGGLSMASCYDCRVELARVVDAPPGYLITEGQILQLCPDCEDVVAPAYVAQTYRPAIDQLLARVMSGLGLLMNTRQEVVLDAAWHLGNTEPRPGKMLSWYFAKRLHDLSIAEALYEQLRLAGRQSDAVILTSSPMPLLSASPLVSLQVVGLSAAGRLGKSSFIFVADRLPGGGKQVAEPEERERIHVDTLRYVASDGVVYCQGQQIKLTRQQKAILLALIEQRDHELSREALRDAANSRDEDFKPGKAFQRHKIIYQTFFEFDEDLELYRIKVSTEDTDWLGNQRYTKNCVPVHKLV